VIGYKVGSVLIRPAPAATTIRSALSQRFNLPKKNKTFEFQPTSPSPMPQFEKYQSVRYTDSESYTPTLWQ